MKMLVIVVRTHTRVRQGERLPVPSIHGSAATNSDAHESVVDARPGLVPVDGRSISFIALAVGSFLFAALGTNDPESRRTSSQQDRLMGAGRDRDSSHPRFFNLSMADCSKSRKPLKGAGDRLPMFPPSL